MSTALKIPSSEILEQNFFTSVTDDSTIPPTPAPKEKYQLLKAIEVIRDLEDGWNGHRSRAPDPKSVDTAENFISILPFGLMYPTSVYPGTEGSIVFEWKRSDINDTLLMSIDPYFLGFIKINPNKTTQDLGDYDLLPDNLIFPEGIKNHLPPYRKPA